MQKNSIIPNNFKSKILDLGKVSKNINISEIFKDRKNRYLNGFALFLAYFNSIPNFVNEIKIDCDIANQWFADKYKSEIKDLYYNKLYDSLLDDISFNDIFYFIYEDLIVNFDTSNSKVSFLFRKTALSKVEEISTEIHKFRYSYDHSYKIRYSISLLVSNYFGIETMPIDITEPKLSIEDNYNDDFRDIHKIILKRLSKRYDKGLVLLHGKPGTGKTSYIRYLIGKVKKNIIFLPPDMASVITNPNLVSILIDNPNTIFVIEDAEKIVVDREKDGSSPISALLNISDGLLSDGLDIQIICSFNTDISKIDSALMRKGRLIAKYEFKELSTEKAQLFSNKLGFKSNINSPMTLAEIYNQDEMDFQKTKKTNPIGFNVIHSN